MKKKRGFQPPAHKESRKWAWFNYVAVFIGGAIAASIVWSAHLKNDLRAIAAEIKPVYQSNSGYQFINPLLGYTMPNDVREFKSYQSLQSDINTLIAQEGSSAPSSVGIYFRDLSLGRWMGMHQNTMFAPGSLMKVVLMIAYYREAEENPSILNQTLTYSSAVADQMNGVPFETPSNLQVGQQYTVEQLIEAMIENSDNGAKNALLDDIDPASLGDVTTDLGIPYLDVTQNYAAYTISAKQYSVILRVLYDATYLDRDYSDKALGIMAKAQYDEGLIAGVPTSTPVAQKYGESIDNNNPPDITLSNCGIIYYPSHPYILCVMTQGQDLADLTRTIAAISKLTWQDVGRYADQSSL